MMIKEGGGRGLTDEQTASAIMMYSVKKTSEIFIIQC